MAILASTERVSDLQEKLTALDSALTGLYVDAKSSESVNQAVQTCAKLAMAEAVKKPSRGAAPASVAARVRLFQTIRLVDEKVRAVVKGGGFEKGFWRTFYESQTKQDSEAAVKALRPLLQQLLISFKTDCYALIKDNKIQEADAYVQGIQDDQIRAELTAHNKAAFAQLHPQQAAWIAFLHEQRAISHAVPIPRFIESYDSNVGKNELYESFKNNVLKHKQPNALYSIEDHFTLSSVLKEVIKMPYASEAQKNEAAALLRVLERAFLPKISEAPTAEWGKTDPIIQKLTLVNKAIAELYRIPSSYRKDRVESYLKKLRSRLRAGEDVSIPRWYHATGAKGDMEPVKDIVQTGKLKPKYCTPVCLSSASETDYGDCTFAFDHHHTFAKQDDVHYDDDKGRYPGEVHGRIWINLRGSLEFTPTHIAHISTKPEYVDQVQQIVGPEIPVISRDECGLIRFLFELAEDSRKPTDRSYAIRLLPSTWNSNWRR